MWNDGRSDSWNSARDPGFGMSYFNRTDLPYYYALADGFTIGDQYYQSTLTQTNPNRLHLFSGSNGLSVGHFPILDNAELDPGWTWPTAAEVLEASNISWRVYQEADNFDDNGFAWFKSFQKSKPGEPLYEKGIKIVPDIVATLNEDMAAGTLAQVTWIVGPTNLSEHATNHPALGEDLYCHPLLYLLLCFCDVCVDTNMYPSLFRSSLFFTFLLTVESSLIFPH
jgi:phospholipase C